MGLVGPLKFKYERRFILSFSVVLASIDIFALSLCVWLFVFIEVKYTGNVHIYIFPTNSMLQN